MYVPTSALLERAHAVLTGKTRSYVEDARTFAEEILKAVDHSKIVFLADEQRQFVLQFGSDDRVVVGIKVDGQLFFRFDGSADRFGPYTDEKSLFAAIRERVAS